VTQPLARWGREHQGVVDLLVTLLIAALSVPHLVRQGDATALTWVLNFGLILPLVLRQRAPSAVFIAMALVAFVQWILDERLGVDATLLFALYTVASRQPRRRALLAAAALEVGVVLATVRFAPAGDGFAASMVFLSGLVAAALFLGTSRQARRAYLSSLVDRAERLERERDQQARLGATAERTRIAREMHDIIAHSLSVMVALADGAAIANRGGPDAATAAMHQVSATGRQSLTEMRRLLGVLREEAGRTGFTPQPGIGEIDELLAGVREAGLPVQLTVSGAPAPLPPTQATVVYRIVQEALTNSLKHAVDASTASVLLRWSAHQLEVEVSDDGQPTPVGAGARTGGHGLTGMCERVAMFGGDVSAGPRRPSARGWVVHARLPFVDVDALDVDSLASPR
jgi:signal transduction histidine kinase